LLVAELPDREHLVVEIWRDNVQVAEVSRTDGGYALEIYPSAADSPSHVLDLSEFKRALADAEEQLRLHTEGALPADATREDSH